MEHRGLALATLISAIKTTGTLLFGLKKKTDSFGFLKSLKCVLKSLFASLIIGIGIIVEIIALLISVGARAEVYLIIVYFFRIKEVEWAIMIVKSRFN
jgi:peptidoglycan biosynthesis protein MviN/MurJ (putative lipid II flippase)